MTKYLITGGAGFIGSHLVDRMIQSGDRVTVLDDLSTGSLDNLSRHLESGAVDFLEGSILDSQLVDAAIRDAEIVLHLAAAVGVEKVIGDPLGSLRTNIRGSEIVLEGCRRHFRKVLITSTSEIYGKNASDALREDSDRILGSPLKARWSYSEAKAIEELIAFTYWQEFKLPVLIVRLFNTVGPRQVGHYGMVIPRLVQQALSGAEMTIFGDGKQTRCFCHVNDVVDAIQGLLASPVCEGRVFNVGSRVEISILELATHIRDALGSSSEIRLVPYESAYESGFEDMRRRCPDTSLIANAIGWTPTRTLDDVIRDVAADLANGPSL